VLLNDNIYFDTWKYIKIIYIFYFLKFIFDIRISKNLKHQKVYLKKIILENQNIASCVAKQLLTPIINYIKVLFFYVVYTRLLTPHILISKTFTCMKETIIDSQTKSTNDIYKIIPKYGLKEPKALKNYLKKFFHQLNFFNAFSKKIKSINIKYI